jgi:two-component sensor histidine kinase/PAS domain-containing protein
MPDEHSWSLTERIVETIRQPLLVLGQDLTVHLANRAFYGTFAIDPAAAGGRSIYEIGNRQWDIPHLRELLAAMLSPPPAPQEIEVEHDFPRLGRRVVLLNAHPLLRPADRALFILLAIEDVTDQRQSRWLLQHQKELAEKILDTVREPLLILHEDLSVRSANSSFYATFGGQPEDTVGRMIHELRNGQWDIPELRRLLCEVVPDDDLFEDFEVTHDFATLGRRIMLLNARRIDHLQLILLAFEDVTERRRSERERELLISELNHRVKNLFAVVRALATHSDGGRSADEYRQVLLGRMDALSRTHDLLFEADWRGTDLRSLAEALEAFAGERANAIDVDGEAVELGAREALSVSLVLHELATNALKYGALSVPGGRVGLGWRIEPADEGQRLRLRWEERGGPPVSPPDKEGFGTELIRRAFGFELGGAAELAFQPDGLRFEATFPLKVGCTRGASP